MAELQPLDAARSLGRFVLDFRLVMLLLAVLTTTFGDGAPDGLAAAMAAAGFASLVPLLRWDRVAPVLARHPAVFALDVAATVGILAFTGVDGPFTAYAEGTAFLAGVLYGVRGGAFFGGLLSGGYLCVVVLASSAGVTSYDAVVQTPVMFLLVAIGGGAVRMLLAREARTRAELVEVREGAARDAERARLAREMHDTLGKSLHGIALAATALPAWLERDARRAAEGARQLARSAETAAGQARELIHDLRSDRVSGPLADTVAREARAWSSESEVAVEVVAEDVGGLAPESRYELICVLREALRNVARHAGASLVRVELVPDGDDVRLAVTDDGCGPGSDGPEAFEVNGHYGVVGMRERAEHVGGTLAVRAGPEGRGTQVEALVPTGRAAADLDVPA